MSDKCQMGVLGVEAPVREVLSHSPTKLGGLKVRVRVRVRVRVEVRVRVRVGRERG